MTTSLFPFKKIISFAIIALFLCSVVIPCFAEEEPIQISADKMTSVQNSNSVVFSGNVDAIQGTVRIRSDEMTIFYQEMKKGEKGKKQGSQQVDKVFCRGSVEVTSDEWLGTSDTMYYFSKKQLVQLIGNAKTYKGQNMVHGERIDYYLDTGKSEVFGGKSQTSDTNGDGEKPGRVNMTILEK